MIVGIIAIRKLATSPTTCYPLISLPSLYALIDRRIENIGDIITLISLISALGKPTIARNIFNK